MPVFGSKKYRTPVTGDVIGKVKGITNKNKTRALQAGGLR